MKIALVNMPFANLSMPSIALTQLKSVLDARFGNRVDVGVYYLNLDFANYLGVELSDYLVNSADSQNSGLGDWFFRQAAFPSLPNNASAYFTRYFPQSTDKVNARKRALLEHRRGLDSFMDELIRRYHLDEADIVGFTSMFMQNVASFALARKLKERNPRIVTVIGGANCEWPMGQVIAKNVEQIDYVFSGPGLQNFPEFVERALNQEMQACGSLNGVLTKRSHLFKSGAETVGEELSIDVPVPLDYRPYLHTLAGSGLEGEVEPVLLFETSRGCWWGERAHCTFCGLNGQTMAYRAMKPELALQQFDALFEFAPRVSRFDSVDNILPKNYFQDVLPHVKTPPNASLFYEVKADLSEAEVATLAQARVKVIQPGIESLATSTLKLMKKGTSVFTNLILLRNCLTYGIRPAWNLLVGFPGEGEDVYRTYVDVLPNLVHLPPPSGVYPVRFDRYSPYFTQAERYGLKLKPLDFYHLIYPFGEDELESLAYYFRDTNINAEYFQTMAKWIGEIRQKIEHWASLWNDAGSNGGGQSSGPKLYIKKERAIVYDSRMGKVVEHEVGETGREVLRLLKKPKHVGDVAKELGGSDAGAEVAALLERGLIFEEGGRFLSLVLEEEAYQS